MESKLRLSPAQLWEMFAPVLACAILAYAAFYFEFDFQATRFDNLLSATISISSILMGFLGTANAITLTLTSKRKKWLAENKEVWHLVLLYFKIALLINLVLCVFSLCLFSTDIWISKNRGTPFLFPLWVFLSALSIFSFYRTLNLLFLLLRDE